MSELEDSKKKIVVVGGGISGLSAAYFLGEAFRHDPKFEIKLFEGDSSTGGVIRTTKKEGFLLEHGPDSIVSIKPWAVELCRKLGIESELIDTMAENRHSYIVYKGNLTPIPNGMYMLAPTSLKSLAFSPIFSLKGRLRMALEPLISRRANTEDESLASFVVRRLGREALERLAQPMAAGVYMCDPWKLSLKATFPQFLQMEQEHGSIIKALGKMFNGNSVRGPRYSLFKSFRGGIEYLTKTLTDKITQQNCVLNKTATRLDYNSNSKKWNLTFNDKSIYESDAVCLAVPAWKAAELLRSINARLASELETIRYSSAVVVNMAFKSEDIDHRLDAMGMVIPKIEKRSMVACTFCTSKFEGRAPDKKVLLRAFLGGDFNPDAFEKKDTELVQEVLTDLKKLLKIKGSPIFYDVTRHSKVMPCYEIGHLEKVERIKNLQCRIAGLYLTGNAYEGVGIPDCIHTSQKTSESIISSLTDIQYQSLKSFS
ncbi:MAG: protoporphyrinogen oxidase [Planctomycetes bacterium]|nr:protoporphyrinogen oxidase [Planctomycetota bacterium]